MIAPLPLITYVIDKIMPDLIWKIPNDQNEIYLTFDDGPIPEVTPWVLNLLDRENIKATFFCIGDNVHKNAEIYHEIIHKGHATGNHTYHHISGWNTSKEIYLKNVKAAELRIKSRLFRPPYGRITPFQYSAMKENYQIVMWSVLSKDYDANTCPDACISNVITHTKSGSIIVMHDSLKAEYNLKNSLPTIIKILKEKGFRFMPLPSKIVQTNKL